MERERLRLRMLSADPMDMEAQRLIAQEIENKNIEQNMELAMEYNPERFVEDMGHEKRQPIQNRFFLMNDCTFY